MEAFLPLTRLVMLALSTYAQTLFGLHGYGGMTPYQLLPSSPGKIIAAKDVPFVLLSVLVTLLWLLLPASPPHSLLRQ